MKLAVFYHCLMENEQCLLPNALEIVHDQMVALKASGLQAEASEIHVGCNGGEESGTYCDNLLPERATVRMHGLKCKTELRTIRMIEEWLPRHRDWLVLYFHSKGATHPPGDPLRTAWRECFMLHLVFNWRVCVFDLNKGYDAVGCHWMCPPRTPPTQYIFAGNMWWAKASFLNSLPSILERDRVRKSGLDSLESRFEAEVILGNGPRLPVVKDYCPNWDIGRPHM